MLGTNPARILFVAANPVSTERLALDEELRAIEEKLRAAEFRDAFTLVSRWAARADDLLQAFNEVHPTIVHFSGHGGRDGALRFHGDDDRGVAPEAMASLFRALRGDIRVVVFNACSTLAQAEAVSREIDCVVSMATEISDEAARVFSASFYRALGFGHSVRAAFDQGLVALKLAGTAEEQTPRLQTRPGVSAAEVFPLTRPAVTPRIALLSAKTDGAWVRRLQMHLKPVARKAGVEVWDDSAIAPGTIYNEELTAELAKSRVVVVLLSPALLDDDEFESRLGELLVAVRSVSLRLLPLIVSSCAVKDTALRGYKTLHPPDQPLDALSPSDLNLALTAIAARIIASVPLPGRPGADSAASGAS